MNLFSILDRAAGNWPDATAVVDHHRRLTYRELRIAANTLAGELQKAAIREGDKVGLLFPRGIEDIVACFAVARLGGIVVQISPASKAAEIGVEFYTSPSAIEIVDQLSKTITGKIKRSALARR